MSKVDEDDLKEWTELCKKKAILNAKLTTRTSELIAMVLKHFGNRDIEDLDWWFGCDDDGPNRYRSRNDRNQFSASTTHLDVYVEEHGYEGVPDDWSDYLLTKYLYMPNKEVNDAMAKTAAAEKLARSEKKDKKKANKEIALAKLSPEERDALGLI